MNLTRADWNLIVDQCENQNALTVEQVNGFARAYFAAKTLDVRLAVELDSLSVLAQYFHKMIEPSLSYKGYRQIPVVFANGDKGIDYRLIQRAMSNLDTAWKADVLTAVETYREFERIHPFEDGNGRVGHLLWAITIKRNIGLWPNMLPPDIFREE